MGKTFLEHGQVSTHPHTVRRATLIDYLNITTTAYRDYKWKSKNIYCSHVEINKSRRQVWLL